MKIIECKKENVQEKSKPKTSSKSNFEQRKYTKKDFEDLEDQLLGRGKYIDPDKKAQENSEDESFD